MYSEYTDEIGVIFRTHYDSALNVVRTSWHTSDIRADLFAAMIMVADYAADRSEKNREDVMRAVMTEFFSDGTRLDTKELDRRCKLYGEILLGNTDPKCEWLVGDRTEFNDNKGFSKPIKRCAALLGDIIYDSANNSAGLLSIFRNITRRNTAADQEQATLFTQNVMNPLIDEFVQYYRDIYYLD